MFLLLGKPGLLPACILQSHSPALPRLCSLPSNRCFSLQSVLILLVPLVFILTWCCRSVGAHLINLGHTHTILERYTSVSDYPAQESCQLSISSLRVGSMVGGDFLRRLSCPFDFDLSIAGGLNLGPRVYKTSTLPLRYSCLSFQLIVS